MSKPAAAMSVRLSRKQSDALSAAQAADTPSPVKGRKAAASPAGSRKKKPTGSSVRTPSPAGPPSKAASAPAAVASATPRGKARRNAQPDSSPSLSPPGRPLRHLNSADDADEDEGQQATDEEDLLPSDSDAESVGSRAVRMPVRSRSRSNAKGGGSNVWHDAPAVARVKPAASVSWDPDASASPVGTWNESGLSYPAVEGSPFNETGPPRKGSDARRAATAEKERTEARRREQLYKEQQKTKDAATAAASTAATKGQRGCFAKIVRFVFGMVSCVPWLLLISLPHGASALWLTRPSVSPLVCPFARVQAVVLFGGLVVAFLSFSNSLPSAAPSSGGDAVTAVVSSLSSRFPRLRTEIDRVLDPALRHHADSFVGLDASADSAAEADSRSLLEGSLQSFQHPKPLVIVLATDGTSSRGSGVDAASFLSALHEALESSTGTEELALLRVGQADATLAQLRQKLSSHFDATAPPVSPLATWVAPLLSAVHAVAPGLSGFLSGSSSSNAGSLASSLSRGLVFVEGAGHFPRAAAEAFHLWVDDVSAPVARAAFVFEVDVSAVRAAAGKRMKAADAVQQTLERQWEQGKVPRDEVIRPLLGRIVRNVVDLTATAP